MQCLETLSRKAMVLMKEYTEEEILASLDFEEIIKLDKDGNTVIKKVY
jgi:hypothetical protein